MRVAKQWPNKLGWTVRVPHGEADVWLHPTCLAVGVPVAPKREWVESPLRGQPRWVTVEQRKVCFVPLGTDPVEAVRLCLKSGMTIDQREAIYREEIPTPMLRSGDGV